MSQDPARTRDRTALFGAREGNEGIIRCDACPVLCRIRPERSGACGRYANQAGSLVRTDPLVLLERDGQSFVSAVGSGTTYPDFKPAPFIVASTHEGVDTVTVVTEGMFSYCGLKVKIDTDRHLGDECAAVRVEGEQIGHVTTAEYGSQMLSLGGVHHLTGTTKKAGNVTCNAMLALANKQAVEVTIDGGATILLQAGAEPIVNGAPERRMRVGCGAATVGIFAQQWHGHVDEVIVVDDHITGVYSEHQAGKVLMVPPTGIRVRGRRSTPGRYFQVASPGNGWGGTDIMEPLSIIESIDPKVARPGLRLLLTSTTGEDALYCILDEDLRPREAPLPAILQQAVARIGENCEPALTSITFMAGAGGSLRAGVTDNPIMLTRAVQQGHVRITMGGAPCYLWPGGGITIMADVLKLPENSFGSVPTPALVAPLEFILRAELYEQLGGHMKHVVSMEDVLAEYSADARHEPLQAGNPWPSTP